MTSPEPDRTSEHGSAPVSSPGHERRGAGRLATVGLLLVLTVLTGFAIVTALRTNAAATDAAHSAGLNDAYSQARFAVGEEESLERLYRLEPRAEARAEYAAAATSFVSAMRLIARRGTPEDRALSVDLLDQQRAYRWVVGRVFAAVDSGRALDVLRIDRNEGDPRFDEIEAMTLDAADEHHTDAVASVRSLEQIQRVSLIGTPIAFACGLLLLAFFSVILLRQRRRADAAQHAELEAQTHAATALAASNQRLRELDRQKDEFVASVSHELRTPLTSIRGYLAMMIDGGAGELTDEQASFLDTIDRNSNRLMRLVGDLLDVDQLEPGTLTIDGSLHDLAAIVSERVSSAAPVADERGLELTVHADEVIELELDPARFGQVIDNLLSNALKFTPPGGKIEVRVSRAGGQAVVEVADTGMGMSEVEQTQIFERFYRAESAVKQAIQGTGLGLWISRSIVEAHGGTITLKSTSGHGTTFRIELPLLRVPLPEPAVVSLLGT